MELNTSDMDELKNKLHRYFFVLSKHLNTVVLLHVVNDIFKYFRHTPDERPDQ